MRTWKPTGALVLLLLATGPGSPARADEKHDLGKREAIELLAQAASAPAHYVDTILALGARVRTQDLQALEGDVPLTVVALALADRGLDERDFKRLPGATPKSLLEATAAHDAQAPYHSIVQARYVEDITIDVNGRTATGAVRVKAPHAFEATIAFTAFHDAKVWRVLELAFRHSGVRTTLEDGRWKLHVPDARRGAPLDLPRVGTLGPRPTEGAHVVVSVTRDGWIRVPEHAKPLSLRELQRWLRDKAQPVFLREADGASKVDAVLDVDATTPWVVTQWLMQTCAHPEVRIYRIWLGARSRDGQDGAIAIRLPKDRILSPTPAFPRDFVKHKLKLFKLERMAQPSDLRALYAALKKRHEAKGGPEDAQFEIVAPPPKGGGVPHGYVVQVVDVCLAVGARNIVFEGAAMPLGDQLASDAAALKGYIDALRQSPGVPIVKVANDPTPIPPAAGDLPEVPARGRLAQPWGVGVGLAHEVLEEVQEVPEEVPEEVVEEQPVVPDAPIEDAPFEGPASGGSIGVGGGAGGAFRGRGGVRAKPPAVPADAKEREDRAVDDALRWLAAHQAPNGGWGASDFGTFCDGRPVTQAGRIPDGRGKPLYDVGVTGLALQAFLGAGYTNRGRHPFAKVVSKGLRYLKNVQDPEGCFGPRSTQQYIYNHAMAAVAMVEAYGMTGSPIFKGSAQRSLDFIALTRNPYFAWRYGVKPGDNDTSVTGWMLAALWAARVINEDALQGGRPAPLTIDDAAFDGAKAWLDKLTDPRTGRVGYVQRGTGPARPQELVDRFPARLSESMTAVGVLCRMRMGEDARSSEVVRKGLELLASRPPSYDRASGAIDMYYWHWGALATFKAGGKLSQAWREAMLKAIVETQRRDTDSCEYKGSWDPVGPWGPDGGRVYSTAMMALCLQVRYRY